MPGPLGVLGTTDRAPRSLTFSRRYDDRPFDDHPVPSLPADRLHQSPAPGDRRGLESCGRIRGVCRERLDGRDARDRSGRRPRGDGQPVGHGHVDGTVQSGASLPAQRGQADSVHGVHERGTISRGRAVSWKLRGQRRDEGPRVRRSEAGPACRRQSAPEALARSSAGQHEFGGHGRAQLRRPVSAGAGARCRGANVHRVPR